MEAFKDNYKVILNTDIQNTLQEGRTLTQNESKESKHNRKSEREEIPEPGPPARPPIPQRLIGEFIQFSTTHTNSKNNLY